ncbi:MAG: hypothetical protein M1835_004074, partial [Candelina submexicana]
MRGVSREGTPGPLAPRSENCCEGNEGSTARPRGIERKQSLTPFRKSARLQEKECFREQIHQLLSPTNTFSEE